LHFSDSEHSTEDSDFRIDDPDEAAAYEIKKRKIDETGGRPLCHASSRHTRKTDVGGGSSAAAGQPLKTKVVHTHGVPPSQRGKGTHHGPVDVEKEKDITENLGSTHINIWRRLRKENPYRFHERQYTGSDKKFWTESQRAMWDDYYDASEHMKSGFYVIPKSLDTEHFQQYANKDFCFINEALHKLDVFDLVTLSESIQPLVVRQFFCTVHFHEDP
jgi:hypothetical protein